MISSYENKLGNGLTYVRHARVKKYFVHTLKHRNTLVVEACCSILKRVFGIILKLSWDDADIIIPRVPFVPLFITFIPITDEKIPFRDKLSARTTDVFYNRDR